MPPATLARELKSAGAAMLAEGARNRISYRRRFAPLATLAGKLLLLSPPSERELTVPVSSG